MWLNTSRIDARIEKLQEIKRIAGDPELLALLQEFVTLEPKAAEPAKPDSTDEVMESAEGEPKDIPVDSVLQTSAAGGLWGIRRR